MKDVFSHVINFRVDWGRDQDRERNRQIFAKYNSRFDEAFGTSAILADHNSGTIGGEFATDGLNSLRFVNRLYEVINACLTRKAAYADPHGFVLESRDMYALYSRDLADWCRKSPHHYLSWHEQDFGNGKVIAGLKAL